MRVDPVCLPDVETLHHWAPGITVSTATIEGLLAVVPPVQDCRAVVQLGDDLICSEVIAPGLSPERMALARRAAHAVNGARYGELFGLLLLLIELRPEVLADALEGVGWQGPALPPPPEPPRRAPREPTPEPAAPSNRQVIAEVVQSFADDPAGAVELLEAEREAIGAAAVARGLGLPGVKALAAVVRRLEAMAPEPEPEPEPVEVALPATALRVVALAPTVEVIAAEVSEPDPAAERRRVKREAQARRRARVRARADEVQERFSEPARRRWLLRQTVEVVRAGRDPVVVFADNTGLPRSAAVVVLQGLGVPVSVG